MIALIAWGMLSGTRAESTRVADTSRSPTTASTGDSGAWSDISPTPTSSSERVLLRDVPVRDKPSFEYPLGADVHAGETVAAADSVAQFPPMRSALVTRPAILTLDDSSTLSVEPAQLVIVLGQRDGRPRIALITVGSQVVGLIDDAKALQLLSPNQPIWWLRVIASDGVSGYVPRVFTTRPPR
jgi:hypothetical protein